MAESRRESRDSRVTGLSKLRSSCDECGEAKLKCDRRQPSCSRCLHHGLQCQYSFSRKMGRPRRSSLQPAAGQPRRDAVGANKGAGVFDIDSTDGSAAGEETNCQTDIPSGTSTMPVAWPGSSGNPTNLNLNDWDDQGMLRFLTSDDLLSDWAAFTQATASAATLPTALSTHTSADSIDHLPLDLLPPGHALSKAQQGSSHTPDSIGNIVGPNLLSIDMKPDHQSCVEESIRLLSDLSIPHAKESNQLASRVSSSRHNMTWASSSHISLDSVLRSIRQAVDSLIKLLACSCAESPAVSMVHASIIARILCWFKEAIAAISTPTDNAPAFDQTSHSSPSSTARSSSSHLAALLTPTCIAGPCEMPRISTASAYSHDLFDSDDAETGRALCIQLLLGELKKVGKIITGFATTRGVHRQPLSQNPQARSAESLHQSVCAWLESEYSIVRNLTKTSLTQLNT